MTAEPRMEDLLASIRKAMDDEAGTSKTAASAPGALMRGTLREMRVAFEKPDYTNIERPNVDELRQRVQRNNARAGFSAPETPPLADLSQTAPVRQDNPRSGFARILAGLKEPKAAAPAEPDPPYLRRTLVEDDHGEEHAVAGNASEEEYEIYDDDGAGSTPGYDAQSAPEREARFEDERVYPATPYAPPLPPEPRQPVAAARPRPAAPPRQAQRAPHADLPPERALVSEPVARASRNSFEDLAETLLARATSDRGLEDMTREMLRGMLRQWLDENLAPIVEQLVREEIERVARRGH